MKGFLANLYLRPSCYHCPTKPLKSGSDITIGDYWGIEKILPEFDDDKGISLVMLNTTKGKGFYDTLIKDEREKSYIKALIRNPNIEKSVAMTLKRSQFFDKWHYERFSALIKKLTHIPIWVRLKRKVISVLVAVLKRVKYFFQRKINIWKS
jgi:hypothetical protein